MAKSTPAQLFAKFFRVFVDTAAAPVVRAEAEKRMDAWLKHHGKTRADIQSILAQAARDDAAAAPPPPPSDPRDAASAEPIDPHDTVLSLVCGAFKTYLAVNSHEYVALALWAMHTHVYDRYMVTPRLLLTSPVRGCGKSVGLDVLSRLVARSELTDNITAAAVSRASPTNTNSRPRFPNTSARPKWSILVTTIRAASRSSWRSWKTSRHSHASLAATSPLPGLP